MDEVERKRFLDTLRGDDDFRATVSTYMERTITLIGDGFTAVRDQLAS